VDFAINITDKNLTAGKRAFALYYEIRFTIIWFYSKIIEAN